MRQYDELAQKDSEFGIEAAKRRKKKGNPHQHLADELLDDLNNHEKDMNDMLKYLSEVEELIKG